MRARRKLELAFVLGAAGLLGVAACSAGGAAGGGDSPGNSPNPVDNGGGGDGPMFGGSGDPQQMAPRDSCASAAYKSTLLPSSLLFLVDRSGSMNCNLPPMTDSATCEQTAVAADPTQPTKWSVINGAMDSAFDQLATVPNTSVGLTLFSADDVCGVQSTPNVALAKLGAVQVDALKAALKGVDPAGGTPLVGATILGFRHLHQEAQARGNRYVVLVTDGSDSCFQTYASSGVPGDVVQQLLNVELPKAIHVNIRTFVIGAPGSEPARGLLSKIAFAGGTARSPDCDHGDNPAPGTECHFDMTRTTDFAKDLAVALQGVTGAAAMTCEFDLPAPTDGKPVDPNRVNVDYYKAGNTTDPAAKVALYRDDTKPCEGGANGWQYTDSNTRIRVCGDLCNQVRTDVSAQVVVSLGCEQRVAR